jgi:hypothetical protein
MVSPRTVARALADTATSGLTVPIGQSGVVLGRDQAGQPVLVRLFGSAPVTVAFIGRAWAARALVLRCLAHGATVLVDAAEPAAASWYALDGPGPGLRRVRPMAGDPSLAWGATGSQPLLLVHDVGPAGPAHRPAPQPWQAHLTVLTAVTAESASVVKAADLVLVQRLSALEAGQVAGALLLAPDHVAQLSTMDNEMVLAVRGSTVRTAWLTLTALERQAFS